MSLSSIDASRQVLLFPRSRTLCRRLLLALMVLSVVLWRELPRSAGSAMSGSATTTPAILTVEEEGDGVANGYLTRLAANGEVSCCEPLFNFDSAAGQYIPTPINLGPEGEHVFMTIYVKGLAVNAGVQLLMGGDVVEPLYVGPPDGGGLSQINVEIPRSLAGRGLIMLAVTGPGLPPTGSAEIEIAASDGDLPPNLSSFNPGEVLAGQSLEVTGGNFAATLTDNEVYFTSTGAAGKAETVEGNKLLFRVPFGAGSGPLALRTKKGEKTAPNPINVRTSISGFVEDTNRNPLAGARVSVGNRNSVSAIVGYTDDNGSFVLPDVPATLRANMTIEPPANDLLNFPPVPISLRVSARRDNQLLDPVAIQGVSATGAQLLAGNPLKLAAPAQSSGVTLTPTNVQAVLPDGTRLPPAVTLVANSRLPVSLPVGHFSTRIAQITPFGTRLTPAAKLTFSNSDNIPAGTARLFKYDQNPDSGSFGQFVDIGAATVNGTVVETAAGAVTEGTYYFVSSLRQTAALYGHVIENDERPVRRAIVRARGQSALTDNNGGFVLRNVPVLRGNDSVALEVSFQRPDGSVARAASLAITINANALQLVPSIKLPAPVNAAGPQLLAPASLAVAENRQSDFRFLALNLASGQNPTVSGASFAAVLAAGNGVYILRLRPGANTAGSYTVRLRVSGQSGSTEQTIALTVNRAAPAGAPAADFQAVTTDEDTPVNITLAGSGGSFRIVNQPLHGILTGTVPALSYRPARDYNGMDSFAYQVSGANGASSPAIVTIAIRPINDRPVLGSILSRTASAGELVEFDIVATDPDAGQTLTFGLPDTLTEARGASLRMLSPTRYRFSWQPTFAQAGTQSFTVRVQDNGLPSLPALGGAFSITVDPKWARTSGPEGGRVNALLSAEGFLFAGIEGGGVFRSENQGRSWTPANVGLSNNDVFSLATLNGDLFAGTSSGIFRSRDKGQNWAASAGLTGRLVRAFALVGTRLYAGLQGDGVFVLNNATQRWEDAGRGLPNDARVYDLATVGTTLYAGLNGTNADGGIYRLRQGESTWTNISTGLTGSGLTIDSLSVVGSRLYAGTLGGLFRLENGLTPWVRDPGGIPNSELVTALVSNGGTTLYAVTRNGAYISTNSGGGWSALNAGLPGFPYFEALTLHAGSVFAGAYGGGVFRLSGSQWTASNTGLTSAEVASFASLGGALYAGSFGAGIFRTTNNGQVWLPRSNGLATRSVAGFAAVTNNFGSVLLAGTTVGGGFRSLDEGVTWQAMPGLACGYVRSFAGFGQSLFATTQGCGVFRSTNQGVDWSRPPGIVTDATAYAFAVANGQLFVSASDGVYRYDAVAARWDKAGQAPESVFFAFAAVDNILFGDTQARSYRSSDFGRTWQQIILPGIAHAFTKLPNGLFVAGTSTGVYRSTDQGVTWQEIKTGLPETSVKALIVHQGNLFAGTRGGAYLLSNNGQSWSEDNAGLNNRFVNALALSGNDLYAGTLAGGVWRFNRTQRSWAQTTGLPSGANVQALAISGTTRFAGLFEGGVYRAAGNGAWEPFHSGLPPTPVNALAVNGANLYAATDQGVYFSPLNAANWQRAGSNLNTTRVLSLFSLGTTVYAGTEGSGVYTRSGSGNWISLGDGLGAVATSALAFGFDSATLYAGTDSGLYRQSTRTARWEPINNGLPPNLSVYALAVSGNDLFAGSYFGVFRSTDRGNTWSQVNAGLLNIYVSALVAVGDTLYAGTNVGGGAGENIGGLFESQFAPAQNCLLEISAEPVSRSIPGGRAATLTVTANTAAGRTIQYQWYRGVSGDFANPIANANAATYTTPPLSATANYFVLISNECGRVASQTAAVVIEQPPPKTDLAVTQSATPAQARPGETVTYTLRLRNSGESQAFAVTLTEALPATLSFQADSCVADDGGACSETGNTMTIRFPLLAAGKESVVTLRATVGATASGALISNAQVRAATTDGNSSNNSAMFTINVIPSAPTTFEADVAPGPNGSGTVTVSDWVQIGRFASGGEAISGSNEFQRADCAPRTTFGDGRISVSDWVQAGRYAAGLDDLVPAAGPTVPLNGLQLAGQLAKLKHGGQGQQGQQGQPLREPRLVNLAGGGFVRGQLASFAVELAAHGDENALGFSLRFDPARLRFARVDAGGAVFSFNAKNAGDGRLGFTIALPAGQSFAAGMRRVVVIKFYALAEGEIAALSFADEPVARELVSANAEALAAHWSPAPALINLPAASFAAVAIARGSIIAAFGEALAVTTATLADATAEGEQSLELAGTSVTITDSQGSEHRAPLCFVSPQQVNYLLPETAAPGWGTVTITSGDGTVSTGSLEIAEPSPGQFAANIGGQGLVAMAWCVAKDGTSRYASLLAYDYGQRRVIAAPLKLGASEQVSLMLFGRHWRQPDGAAVTVMIDGMPAETLSAGMQNYPDGLAQLNVRVPNSHLGPREMTVEIVVNGKRANAGKLLIE